MKFKKNNSKGLALLEKLEKNGDLINIYSDNFLKRLQSNKDIKIIKKNANNSKIKNHLLFIFVNEYKKDIHEELKAIYPQLEKFFSNHHLPDFILLNNNTKQMVCVGFGRKNQLFIIDSETDKNINFFDLVGGDEDEKYINQFIENDVFNIVRFFLYTLNDFSLTIYQFDNLPGNYDAVGEALDNKNIKDGLHYIEGVEQGYTTKEIKKINKSYDTHFKELNEILAKIRIFFGQCEIGELNTGDY
jgi:hypothetical protein